MPRIRTSKQLRKQGWHFKNSAQATPALPIPIIAHSAVVISSSPARGQHRGRTITILAERAPLRCRRRCRKMEGRRQNQDARLPRPACASRDSNRDCPAWSVPPIIVQPDSGPIRTSIDTDSSVPSRCKQCVAAPEQCGKNSRCPNASTRKSCDHSPDGNSALTPDLKYLLPPDSDRAHAAPARACLTALSDNAQGRTSARTDSQSAISERTAGTLVRRAAQSRLRGSESSVRPPANSRATPRCRGSTPDDLIPQNSTQQ